MEVSEYIVIVGIVNRFIRTHELKRYVFLFHVCIPISTLKSPYAKESGF